MGCNANNHPADCRCGWGGDGHRGKSSGGSRSHIQRLPLSQTNIVSVVETENCLSHCPICQSEVAFIKHNGGSVWLDIPLGPPWYKHACFDKVNTKGNRGKLSKSYESQQKYFSLKAKIIVVASCIYNSISNTTSLKAQFEDNETYSFSVRGDARIFVGHLCFIDESVREVWPIDDHNKKLYYQGAFSRHLGKGFEFNRPIVHENNVKNNKEFTQKNISSNVSCRVCNCLLGSQKNYRRHLLKVHGAILLPDSVSTSFMVVEPEIFYCESLLKEIESEKEKISNSSIVLRNPDAKLNHNSELYRLIFLAYRACAKKDGYASLGKIGKWLRIEKEDFNPNKFGYKNLSLLVQDVKKLEVKKVPMLGTSESYNFYVRFYDNDIF